MSDEIKDRIERLIGEGPGVIHLGDILSKSIHLRWKLWRQDLIERLAQSAQVMSGLESRKLGWSFGDAVDAEDTHTALILDVLPIRKGVTKAEIVQMLDDAGNELYVQGSDLSTAINTIARRIEKEGVVSDE